MRNITIDGLIDYVTDIESKTQESAETAEQIELAADAVLNVIEQKCPVCIITDYDADGICSAYILEHTMRRLNPDIDLKVITNDRRNPYGVPKDLVAEQGYQYIVLDMGSNELDYIRQTFGHDTLVFDHHPIEDPEKAALMANNPRYLNTHSIEKEPGMYADYCATGLAQRVSQTIVKRVEGAICESQATIERLNNLVKLNEAATINDLVRICGKNGIELQAADSTTVDNNGVRYNKTRFYVYDNNVNGWDFGLIEFAENAQTGRLVHALGNITLNIAIHSPNDEYGYKKCYGFRASDGKIVSPFDEKFINTRDIIAGIGTVADMVSVLDPNGYNRQIIKTAFDKVNNADENNIEFNIGYFLRQCKIDENDVNAKKFGFNVAPVLNAASRMSEITGTNGAQEMYDALSPNQPLMQSLTAIDKMITLNAERQNISKGLQDDKYWAAIEDERFGKSKNDKIVIYEVPENTPTAFCGLLAGKLSESVDKPVIVLTSHTDAETGKTVWSGSGRGVEKAGSLRAFFDTLKEHRTEYPDLEIVGGGHERALGISKVTDITAFKALVSKYQQQITYARDNDPVYLSVTPQEIEDPATMQKIKSLEPLGNGLTLPPVILAGKEMNHGVDFKANNPNWKTINLEVNGNGENPAMYKISDWGYSEQAYPTDENGNIELLGQLEINDYHGEHLEFTAKYDKDFLEDRALLLDRLKKTAIGHDEH